MWMRDPFLASRADHGKVVAHGIRFNRACRAWAATGSGLIPVPMSMAGSPRWGSKATSNGCCRNGGLIANPPSASRGRPPSRERPPFQ